MASPVLSLASIVLALVAPIVGEPVTGTGRATVAKDVESVRNSAAADARRQIIVAMLTNTIGVDRLREVSPQTIATLAEQIRPDMINGQTSRREGSMFLVTLSADIDGAWFRNLLDNYGIDSSSARAGGDRQLIFVMLDQEDKVASDFATPAQTHVAYDRSVGASFSDQSSTTSTNRNASASASRSAGAYSASGSEASRSSGSGAYRANGSAAYGSSGTNYSGSGRAASSTAGGFSGSDARAQSSRQAGAFQAKSAQAQSSSSSFADRTNVAAEQHDIVSFREDVIYQRPVANSDGDAIMSALKGSLGGYGVQTADPWGALSSYFSGQPPRYATLKRDARFRPFLSSLGALNAPFFLGGTYRVTHSGTDPATGQALCSGTLDASASATRDGADLASGFFNASGSGMSSDACSAKVAASLAAAAAEQLGPKIQNHWRRVARGAVGQDTTQLANYTLIVRSARFDMAMQADILDVLQATPGVESQSFVSQDDTEMRFTVRYSGSMPLQLALFQKLRNREGFAGMQSKAEGRSVLLCLTGCSTGQ